MELVSPDKIIQKKAPEFLENIQTLPLSMHGIDFFKIVENPFAEDTSIYTPYKLLASDEADRGILGPLRYRKSEDVQKSVEFPSWHILNSILDSS